MLVFNNQQRSGYEEIASYGPGFWQQIREMDAVYRLAGWLTDLMAADMEAMISNQFLAYMHEEALKRYEAFLGIETDSSKDTEERKAYIRALLVGSGKLSKDKIAVIVNQFVDCQVILELKDSALYINMTFQGNPDRYMETIRNLIRGKVPAHIKIIYRGTDGLNLIVELQNTVRIQSLRNKMTFLLFSFCIARDTHRLNVRQNETFEIGQIIIKKNLHFLDGSFSLDGQIILNAEEWKEKI